MTHPTDKESVAALVSELRAQSAEWKKFAGQSLAASNRDLWNNVADLCSRAAVALFPAQGDGRTCTCHPDDKPPTQCPQKYALNDCREAAKGDGTRDALVKEFQRFMEVCSEGGRRGRAIDCIDREDWQRAQSAIKAALASHPDRALMKSYTMAVASDVLVWFSPHLKHIVSFNTLCEAMERILANHLAPQPGMTDEQARRIWAEEYRRGGEIGYADIVEATETHRLSLRDQMSIAAIKRAAAVDRPASQRQ